MHEDIFWKKSSLTSSAQWVLGISQHAIEVFPCAGHNTLEQDKHFQQACFFMSLLSLSAISIKWSSSNKLTIRISFCPAMRFLSSEGKTTIGIITAENQVHEGSGYTLQHVAFFWLCETVLLKVASGLIGIACAHNEFFSLLKLHDR